MNKPVRRFDVVLISPGPVKGREMKKTRPCLVISPDEMNAYIRTIIVAPMTSTKRPYPARYYFLDHTEKSSCGISRAVCSMRMRRYPTLLPKNARTDHDKTLSPSRITRERAVRIC